MAGYDDQYFSDNFNTKLGQDEESKFQKWADDNGKNVQDETLDYDLRGFWKSGGEFADNGHGADTFKKPNHPTFSDQSQYHNTDAPHGKWIGGTWSEDDAGVSYTPSAEMLKHTHPVTFLRNYMADREPDVKLNMDRVMNPKEEYSQAWNEHTKEIE